MKNQTPVEFLIEQVNSKDWQDMFIWHKEEVFQQAKEMHKQEMCKFAYKCHNHYKVNGDFKIEQYYNENYEK